MSHTNTQYQQLLKQGQLQAINDCRGLIAQEQRSLQRLRQKPASFLNMYDRLFRHVCLQLLAQGLAITQHQPHQTLQALLRTYLDQNEIKHLVLVRHAIKHGERLADIARAESVLLQLLQCLNAEDAQAYERHVRAQSCGIV